MSVVFEFSQPLTRTTSAAATAGCFEGLGRRRGVAVTGGFYERRVMSPHGAPFLGAKRPREEHEHPGGEQAAPVAVEYPSSMVAEVGNNAAEHFRPAGGHSSPPRHTPGTSGARVRVTRTRGPCSRRRLFFPRSFPPPNPHHHRERA